MKWLVATYVLFQIDSKSKRLAEDKLKIGDKPIPVAGGKIMLQRVKNKGIAGGILSSKDEDVRKIATVGSALIGLNLLAELPRKGRAVHKTAAALLAAGAAGNLYDRWTRGSVTDFIRLGPEYGKISDAIFNLADVWILIGGAVLIPVRLIGK